MRGPTVIGKFSSLSGNKLCRHVYEVSDRPRTEVSIYRNAQGHGAQKGFGEGISTDTEAARF